MYGEDNPYNTVCCVVIILLPHITDAPKFLVYVYEVLSKL